ncbi:MAG: nciI, partial [Phototrophicales bacterium]
RKTETDTQTSELREFFRYSRCLVLQQFSMDNFLKLLQDGVIFIDFDARTGHNHGTKFRIRRNHFPELYAEVEEIF